MHGQETSKSPHGPCIMCSEINAHPKGSFFGSGISACVNESIREDVGSVVSLVNQTIMCA